jgi:hypothetical protein
LPSKVSCDTAFPIGNASELTSMAIYLVYELSSVLSIRAENHPQLISSLSVLVPGIYLKAATSKPADENLEAQVQALSIASKAKPPRMESNDNRAYYTSLLLIYQIAHRDSPVDFWTDYFKLTRPSGKKPNHQPPFVTADHPNLRLALDVYRAIIQPSPLTYYRILRSDLKPDQKVVIGFALPKMRERTWGMMRSGWAMGMKVDFAGSLLGYEIALSADASKVEDEWDDHLKNGSTGRPRADDLITSLGGRLDSNKVLFR